MKRILTDEELDALLELYRSGDLSGDFEVPPGDDTFMIASDVHRRFFRLHQLLPATLIVEGHPHTAKASNIGLGGVFILSDVDLPVGTQVDVDVNLLKPAAKIHVKGSVCWLKKGAENLTGLGIRFSSLDTDHIWAIVANMKEALTKH